MVDRADQPSFYLPGIGPDAAPWSDQKRNWTRAAGRVGVLLGQDYLFIPGLDPYDDSVFEVKVKVSTAMSKWSSGKLYPRFGLGPINVVENGIGRTLKRSEVSLRHNWTRVARP